MKKLFAITIGLLFILTACSKTGTVYEAPKDFIIIHGKTYKIMQIVPSDGDSPIWIMYPKDSTDTQPEVINWTRSSGKRRVDETLIKVD